MKQKKKTVKFSKTEVRFLNKVVKITRAFKVYCFV